MSLRTVQRMSLVASLVMGVASTSSAAPSAEDEKRRLGDHLYFVTELKRGWEPLLADVERTLAALGGSATDDVRSIADVARESIARAQLARGEAGEARALELYEKLATSAVVTSKRPAFHAICADILMGRADRAAKAGNDAGDADAIAAANAAMAHVPAFPRAIEMIGRLGFKVAAGARAREDYEAAIEGFKKTMDALQKAGAAADSPKLKEGRAAVADIQATTGSLKLAWIGDPQALGVVKGQKTDFTHATLQFSGAGKVPPPPAQTVDKLRRMRSGTWQVVATGVGAGAPYTTPVTVPPDGEGVLSMIPIVPDGMVYVPAAGEDDAFLIDRTEVSNQQFQAMTGQARGGSPDAAASGVTFADASRAAAAAGKRLPTLAQWTHAAFGEPFAKRPRYPWGDQPGQAGRFFVANATSAQSVESCPDGRSPFGCINMAGNVWEWLDREGGWLIGFGWNLSDVSDLDSEMPWPPGSKDAPWKADFLRDPIPSPEGFAALKLPEERRKYSQNIATADGALAMAGFRCVVPLGRTRR